MFILNKETGMIQECRNKDAINSCQKDTEHFVVAETLDKLVVRRYHEKPPEEDGENDKEEKNVPENKKGPQREKKEVNLIDQLSEEEQTKKLETMKVSELREIAKAKGIQGYANMNKDTIVAMIMNH